MTSPSEIKRLVQDTRRYEYSDGLRDLQLAIYFAISSVTLWLIIQPSWIIFLQRLGKIFGRQAAWLGILLIFIAPLAVLGMLAVINFIRKRWLWRESGMVKPTRWVVPRRITVVSVVILVAGLVLGILARRQGWVEDTFILRMLWTATGWSFGYTLVGMGRELGLLRYIGLGLIGGALSTILLFIQLSFAQVALVFGLSWGFLLTASGLITLRKSIRITKEIE